MSNTNNFKQPYSNNNNNNRYNNNTNNNYATNNQKKTNPPVNVNTNNSNNNNNNDEDFLDISDNELIRASQVVESQLKFTNNVHHTTSNAINIFSQFNSNYNEPAQSQSMGPPMSSSAAMFNGATTGANSKANSAYSSQFDAGSDELKT